MNVSKRMDDITLEMKNYYTEWWENPEDPRDFIFKALNTLVLERLPDGHGKRALDIGSGKGAILEILLRKGYDVTAVEINEEFTHDLRRRYPHANVVQGDFNKVHLEDRYDIVTAIEFIQNLDKRSLLAFMEKVGRLTDRLVLNVSNKFSLHGIWTAARGFQKPFVFTYTPKEIKWLLVQNGFQTSFSKGIGFVTPITLLSGFRIKLIPEWFARGINAALDPLLPGACHLYYIEAQRKIKERM